MKCAIFKHDHARRANWNSMFHPELVTSPWHYYEYKEKQEFITSEDWKGKNVVYSPSRGRTPFWWIATCDAANGYRWMFGRSRPYVPDPRLLVFCCDWSNALSPDTRDHENAVKRQNRLWAIACPKERLAAALAPYHPKK